VKAAVEGEAEEVVGHDRGGVWSGEEPVAGAWAGVGEEVGAGGHEGRGLVAGVEKLELVKGGAEAVAVVGGSILHHSHDLQGFKGVTIAKNDTSEAPAAWAWTSIHSNHSLGGKQGCPVRGPAIMNMKHTTKSRMQTIYGSLNAKALSILEGD
jgi:hypothetical protein